MNAKLKKIIETQSRYIHISIPFYADDYTYPSCDFPKHPLVTNSDRWEITIDLKNHTAEEWKTEYGFCHVFTKVRDEGKYTLFDKDKKSLCLLNGYVPNGIIPPKDGCGDYIKFEVNENGSVSGWYDIYDYSDFIKRREEIPVKAIYSTIEIQYIWDTIQNIFAPMTREFFHELNNMLYPIFAFSGQFTYLSQSKDIDNQFPIDLEKPINELKNIPKIESNIAETKSLWLSYQVSAPKQYGFRELNLLIVYHIELEEKSYYLPIINRHLSYGMHPSESEKKFIIETLKGKIKERINDKQSGTIQF